MGAQFGVCNFDGRPLDPKDLKKAHTLLAPYGPDGDGSICKGHFGVVYRAFHINMTDNSSCCPHISPSGIVLTWDGCLDNRAELIRDYHLASDSTEVSIVAALYERDGRAGFSKLIGDWALSIWNPTENSITLA